MAGYKINLPFKTEKIKKQLTYNVRCAILYKLLLRKKRQFKFLTRQHWIATINFQKMKKVVDKVWNI